jgi:hypothetical protein
MKKPLLGVYVVLFVAMCLIGCKKPPPPLPQTYPVHGRVVHKDGAPVLDGNVQFHHETDVTVTTTGKIKDGTFSMKTFRKGQLSEGAVPGLNRITINAPRRGKLANEMSAIRSTEIAQPFKVEARDNELNLKVDH